MEREKAQTRIRRPSLGIRFLCNGAYIRLYRHPDAKAYRGHCPRCMALIRIDVAPGGTKTDAVEVTCR